MSSWANSSRTIAKAAGNATCKNVFLMRPESITYLSNHPLKQPKKKDALDKGILFSVHATPKHILQL